MRDMNPRSACRRTPTLMEIHMTTYKPTGEKPDEFNLYLPAYALTATFTKVTRFPSITTR